ncbi:trp operon leader peptide [Streptomyces sp. NRRL WC-3618]
MAGPRVGSRSARGPWCRVRRMFAHSTQNWWWPAHSAAH